MQQGLGEVRMKTTSLGIILFGDNQDDENEGKEGSRTKSETKVSKKDKKLRSVKKNEVI